MILPIKVYPDPILRKRSKEVSSFDGQLEALVNDMIETLGAKNGVGLAAVQIGKLLRVLIIRPVIQNGPDATLGEVQVYINPKLSNPSKSLERGSEGCLSVPGMFYEVERPASIDVKWQDLKGDFHEEKMSGFKAREIMHENDHLNGTLFFDRLEEREKNRFLEEYRKQVP